MAAGPLDRVCRAADLEDGIWKLRRPGGVARGLTQLGEGGDEAPQLESGLVGYEGCFLRKCHQKVGIQGVVRRLKGKPVLDLLGTVIEDYERACGMGIIWLRPLCEIFYSWVTLRSFSVRRFHCSPSRLLCNWRLFFGLEYPGV